MKTVIQKLASRLDGECRTEKLLAIIEELAATNDPAAIRMLAGLLDTPCDVGSAAVDALVAFGTPVIPAMRRCIDKGVDEDMIRNAHRVLAALGDTDSAKAEHAFCWADLVDGLPIAEVLSLHAA